MYSSRGDTTKSLGVQYANLGVTSYYMYICMHLQVTRAIVYGGFSGRFVLLI
jgi:hypothetical protein